MAKTFPKIHGCQLAVMFLVCSAFLPHVSLAQGASPQPPAALAGLMPDHATISVENMALMTEWYERVLGFKMATHMERGPMMGEQLKNANFQIDLIKYTGSKRPPQPDPVFMQQGWIHIAFNVPDLPAALAALKAQNTDAKGGPGSLTLHDPEGNEIEIFARK